MKIMDAKKRLLDTGQEIRDQATRAVEDIQDAAASVKDSTDVVAASLIVLGVISLVTLLLVVNVNMKVAR
jgi:hypothetical protein